MENKDAVGLWIWAPSAGQKTVLYFFVFSHVRKHSLSSTQGKGGQKQGEREGLGQYYSLHNTVRKKNLTIMEFGGGGVESNEKFWGKKELQYFKSLLQSVYVNFVLILLQEMWNVFYEPERPFMHLTDCCWFLICSGCVSVMGGWAGNAVSKYFCLSARAISQGPTKL